ncbi:hypothetical protein [Tessaracoccus sp. ZS01]|uniref:hypothetical protein n=1 Tax=Tessaracoccus sp. ZS01 TaxID=1906324 RepID=UPI00096F824D|nr:hypothetical protein [Tessaracoccus sp. ZS01]MCG6567483.1 tetratricopeptide repeat protein [Tessaracoccus sp. ZS01]OMG57046.1 hypothetical protein BJN44_07610 [Tessaracoccus sp. ZS01]
MTDEIRQAIRSWWVALKAHHGMSDEGLAELIESEAFHAGADRRLQPVDRRNISAWRKRGQFPPNDRRLQASVVQLMANLAFEASAPEGVGQWTNPEGLYRAWLSSRADLEAGPAPKTIEANARKTQTLVDVLVEDPERSVADAASLEGLRDGFWQGSWVTEGATPPYVARAVDGMLDERIAELANANMGGFIVVVGPPKAGKTRLVLEALGRVAPERKLWELRATDGALDAAVAAVADDGGRRGPHAHDEVVVLLDDLQRHNFRTPDGINDRTLNRAINQGLIVIATLHDDVIAQMQAFAYDRTRRDDGMGLHSGATPGLLRMISASRIDLAPELTGGELAGIPKELLAADAICDAGPGERSRLPELLAAVDALRGRALAAMTDRAHPEHVALLTAAVDAAYLNPAGIGLAEFEQLTQWSFERLFPTRHWDPFLFVRAFEWATEPLGGPGSVHAVVRSMSPGRAEYALFDPLVETLEAGEWDPSHLAAHADSLSPEICLMAANWCSDQSAELTFLHRASSIPVGAWSLARAYDEMECFDLAEEWYLRAAEAWGSKFPGWWGLSELYLRAGRRSDSERVLLRATEGSCPEVWLRLIAHGYGLEGDEDNYLRWLLRAVRAGDEVALFEVARYHLKRGERGEGERYLGLLALEGAAEGYYQASLGLHPEMQEPYIKRAARLGHPDALQHQAAAAEMAGDVEEASRLRLRVEKPDHWVDLLTRGNVHQLRGEMEEAEYWTRLAAESGKAEAMCQLGEVVGSEAEYWWRRAADLGNARAMALLGQLHLSRDEPETGEAWLAGAANEYFRPAIRLLAYRAEPEEEAERWWLKGIECYDPEAMIGLARHCFHHGRTEEAERWLKRASAQTDEAAYMLGVLLEEQGDTEQADAWLEKASDYPLAVALRGIKKWETGDSAGAHALWQELLDRDGDDTRPALTMIGEYLNRVGSGLAEMWLLAGADQDRSGFEGSEHE